MKVKLLLLLVFIFILLVPVSAQAQAQIDLGTLNEEFFVYTDKTHNSRVAEIIGSSDEELLSYCNKEGIVYVAVNEDNTKQIKLSCLKSSFSEELSNISYLSKQEIEELYPMFIGENSEYEIIEKNSQVFIKYSQKMKDSGGEYEYTGFITVANYTIYNLNFYTANGEDNSYIETVFNSYNSKDFLNYKVNQSSSGIKATTIIISLVSLWIVYTIIRDYLKDKSEKNNQNL